MFVVDLIVVGASDTDHDSGSDADCRAENLNRL